MSSRTRPVTSIIHAVAVMTMAALLAGCATTRLTGEWRDEQYAATISKVLVVGMSANTVFRHAYEDQLVARFREHGVNAVAGTGVLPEGAEITRESIQAAIAGKGFDAVLVTRLIDVDTQKTYVSHADYILPPPFYRDFYDYYHRVYPIVYRRDYLITDTIATLETTLYETIENRLVWVVTSESFNPQRANDLAEELSTFIVDKLVDDGLI